MPEGPEVAVLCQQLDRALSGAKIEKLKQPEKIPEKLILSRAVCGEFIESVFCYGKAIFFKLQDGSAIYNSLGMTGGWSGPLKEELTKARLNLYTSRGIFAYTDARMFGRLQFLTAEKLEEKLESLGPDPLRNWKLEKFLEVMEKHPRCGITSFLMNQNFVAGIGNYLKSEILFAAKISPNNRVESLGYKERKLLFEIIKNIANESFQAGGFSMSDYFHLNGEKGKFRPTVYGQDRGPCHHNLCKQKTADGRQTYWCQICQK